MNPFAQHFLNEDWSAVKDAPQFYLSAFGKHPGWRDHLDDIGLATMSLVEARRVIYSGIAHQIESAAWEKAGAEKVAPGFNHIIHWTRMKESLTGLMWSSQDAKGRSLYPMILIAHSVGQSFSTFAGQILPVLEAVEAKCRATTSAQTVIAVMEEAQNEFRHRPPPQAMPGTAGSLGLAAWTAHYSKEQVALRRVIYHIRSNFAPFTPGAHAWAMAEKPPHARTLRLPQLPGCQPAESMNAWLTFLQTQLDPAVPLLGLLPINGNWLDVVVGEPALSDFFLLRSLTTSTPLITDIPYQLDPNPLLDGVGLFEALAQGRMPPVSCLNGGTVETNQEMATKWLLKFRPGSRPGFFGRLFS